MLAGFANVKVKAEVSAVTSPMVHTLTVTIMNASATSTETILSTMPMYSYTPPETSTEIIHPSLTNFNGNPNLATGTPNQASPATGVSDSGGAVSGFRLPMIVTCTALLAVVAFTSSVL